MEIKDIKQVDLEGKRVFLRVDFNVPLNEKKEITDETRIRAALPTINYLLEKRCKVILASHLGRPKGKVVESLRIAPVKEPLEKLLNKQVTLAPDCIGAEVENLSLKMKEGELLLLENGNSRCSGAP